MEKIKVIDLLNKIANVEEVPKKFQYEDMIFIYNDELGEHFDKKEGNSFNYTFDLTDIRVLNDEIEIIEDTPKEDNKIEKIKDYSIMTTMGLDGKLQKRKISKAWKLEEIVNKINEIIDKVNGE